MGVVTENVLILIILEYIYMLPPQIMTPSTAIVLILIILEYIYIGDYMRVPLLGTNVLILIILEYIYIPIVKMVCRHSRLRLNPYYTGIHLHLLCSLS